MTGASGQLCPVALQFRLVVRNMFQHVHTDHRVARELSRQGLDRALNHADREMPRPQFFTEPRFGFDGDQFPDGRQARELGGHLSHTRSHFDHAAFQKRREFADQCGAVVRRGSERIEFKRPFHEECGMRSAECGTRDVAAAEPRV